MTNEGIPSSRKRGGLIVLSPIGGAVPDVLALERVPSRPAPSDAVEAASPEPTATIVAIAEEPSYPPAPRVLVVRHVTGDRVVAITEIVSPGNKKEAAELGSLVEKTVTTLARGIHVVLVDLFPPGPLDPRGLHNVVWTELGQPPTSFDPERPLQVSSYLASRELKAFIEPRRAGESLPAIPLFLRDRRHVFLPLESSYATAFSRLPKHLRQSVAL